MASIAWFFWDPKREIFTLPYLQLPILWYSLLFAFGFFIGYFLFFSLLQRYLFLAPEFSKYKKTVLSQEARKISDRLLLYIIIATVVGARLGHMFFYERPSSYLLHPWEIVKTWQGGLASHGAAIAIVFALFLFYRSLKKTPFTLSYLTLLDLVALPVSFVAVCIRIGNFFNQEISGTPSTVPWAVVFGHPYDGTFPCPRHPVQLYEAFFYFFVFLLLGFLSKKSSILLKQGRMIGLFLTLVFSFRFFIEFWKEEQSHLLSGASLLSMGQYLSLPFILLGIVCFLYSGHSKKRS